MQELVFARLNVHAIGGFHDERPAGAGDWSKLRAYNDDTTLQWNLQLSMAYEVVWSLGKPREEAPGVFIHTVVESRNRFHVQELVKESATSSPLVTIINPAKIPRIHIHA